MVLLDIFRGAMNGMRAAWGQRYAQRSHPTSTLKSPADWLLEALGAKRTASGVLVTPTTALEATPLFAAVRNICEDLASLPLIVYERLTDNKRERARSHPLYELLHDQPNDEMDSMQFVETMQAHAMLRPSAYAEIVRSTLNGAVVELWPLHPDRVHPFRREGERFYRVDLPEGERSADGLPWDVLAADQVFRLRGLSLDGWDGLSTVRVAQESIGLTMALEHYGAELFGNDATPGGFFQHPGQLGEEALRHLRESIEKRHQGLGRKHRIEILEEGMKFAQAGLRNDHAQFLESRKFQVEEQARIARIPLHMVGALDRATFSNIEHQGIEYVVHTIRPRAVRFERAVGIQLLTRAERQRFYARFLLDALMRGDQKSRYEAYAIGRTWGWLSANDVRRLEEMDDIEGGDVYLEQENMRPAGKWQPKTGPTNNQVARAFERLFVAGVERCVRKEAVALERAAKKPLAEFEPWARSFFADQEADVREALEPVVDGLARLTHAAPEDVSDYVALLARRYAKAAVDELAEEVRGALPHPEAAIRRWAETRRGRAEELGRMECERTLRLFALGTVKMAA